VPPPPAGCAPAAPGGPPDSTRQSGGGPVLELRNLTKSFGGAHALDGVDLTVEAGEVHGLLGENGSGKSTLIKILAGYHVPESGTLKFNGSEIPLPLHPGQFRDLGLSFVHQDLGLLIELTALENLKIVSLSRSSSMKINWKRERKNATEIFERYGVDIRPDSVVADLSETDRARLAIIRAIEDVRNLDREGSELLVLDEPTVFLSKKGTEDLFELVRGIAAQGSSVLFVSHDLDEVFELTDRVTVLRDGKVQDSVVTSETDEDELIRMIVGRRLAAYAPPHRDTSDLPVVASVKDLAGRQLRGASFEAHRGEVLGLTGLLGSGFEDIPYLLFGAKPCFGGQVEIDGATYDLAKMDPQSALDAGFALIPGDRQNEGSIGSMTVGDNVMLQVLDDYGSLRLPLRKIRKDAETQLSEFDVRPSDPQLQYHSLSGGNQQKALLVKWLQTKPSVLLVHEPTQGVDIGARGQIFRAIEEAAEGGMCVICSSTDYEQLAQICDRVLCVHGGLVTQQLAGDELTKQHIAEQVHRVSARGGNDHVKQTETES
jgi:ribose transport system ATP-binding protein